MNITDTINDLQNVLKQQNSIYETNQHLHFDWLQSVIFQLNVYDQPSKGDIKVNESKSITDLENIKYNYDIQQQNVLNTCKKQIRQLNKNQNEEKQSIKQNENSNSVQDKIQSEQKLPDSIPKAIPRARNRRKNSLQKKAASTSFIKPPLEINQNPNKNKNNTKCNILKTNQKIQDSCLKQEEVPSPTHLVKFIDNDSLLSVSQSSDSCADDFYTDNDDQYRCCQSLPSKETPLTISCNITELTRSVSSFQEKWQEMVEEKKRSSLLPKPPVGALFNFDDAPESYQITDSEGDDDFFFSDEDDEIHEEDPLEIHGKMIPAWARKDKVDEQLINQQNDDPDSIFTEMPKHCILTQIFGFSDEVGSSILAEGQNDDDNYEELMSI